MNSGNSDDKSGWNGNGWDGEITDETPPEVKKCREIHQLFCENFWMGRLIRHPDSPPNGPVGIMAYTSGWYIDLVQQSSESDSGKAAIYYKHSLTNQMVMADRDDEGNLRVTYFPKIITSSCRVYPSWFEVSTKV